MTDLDQTILSIAIREAERHISRGCLPDEAVALATPGAWAQFRLQVTDALLESARQVSGPVADC